MLEKRAGAGEYRVSDLRPRSNRGAGSGPTMEFPMQHGELGFLTFGLVLLAAAVLSVPIARRLGLSAIVAYLIAGIVIGPHASVRSHNAGGEAIGERVLVATQIWLKANPASTEQLEVWQSPGGLEAAGCE